MTDLAAPGTPDDLFPQLQLFLAGGTRLARHLAVSPYNIRGRFGAGFFSRDLDPGPAPAASCFCACHILA
jgi:hypothetical protein